MKKVKRHTLAIEQTTIVDHNALCFKRSCILPPPLANVYLPFIQESVKNNKK